MTTLAIVVADEGLGGIVPFGRALVRRGHVPALIAGPSTPRSSLEAAGDVYATIRVLDDVYSPETIVEAVRSLSDVGRAVACFSCYDGLVVSAAEAAARLGLPHPAIAGLVASRHKAFARRQTALAGLPTPRWMYVRDRDDAAAARAAVGFPAVIKPVNGMASHLVRRVNDEGELRAAIAEIGERLERSFKGNYGPALRRLAHATGEPEDALLLEEHLVGDEYSAEIIVSGGTMRRVALFDKWKIAPQGYLECGFTTPPLHVPDEGEAIWQHIEACLRALGVDNTAAHVEVMNTPDGARLLEVNAGRAGGQILVLATRRATGIDLIEEIVSLVCGEPPPPAGVPESRERVTTLTAFPPRSGRLLAIEGLDRVRRLPGVEQVVPFVAPGATIDCDDKEVFAVNVLVSGGDARSLDRLYEQVCRSVTFQIEPNDTTTLDSRDGAHNFTPTTTLRRLIADGSATSTPVRLSGRLFTRRDGSMWLRDADDEAQLALAAPDSIAAGAWLGVEATWDVDHRRLRDARVLFRRDPILDVERAVAESLPEADFVSQPARLGDVRMRARLLALLRRELNARDFLEVQTPFLHRAAENANVTQYETNGRGGRRLYLRTDPEEYLKRYLTAGLDGVFEVSNNVRSEDCDAERLEEFTSVEAYRRFGTLARMMALLEDLLDTALTELRGTLETESRGRSVSFQSPPLVRTVSDAILEAAGIDLRACPHAEDIAEAADARGLGHPTLPPFRGAWIEWLIDRFVLPGIEVPTYLTEFPSELGISACAAPHDRAVCLRAELYLPGGLELAHLYENLTEPEALAQRLEQRRSRRLVHGYDDVAIDEELIASAALGMPPMAGLALGVDRLLMLVLGRTDVGAGLLFPREGQPRAASVRCVS